MDEKEQLYNLLKETFLLLDNGDRRFFDRFDLDFGRDVTKSGDQTVETSFRLSEEITGQGRMYYLTGEKDRYDAYNYGLRLVFRFE